MLNYYGVNLPLRLSVLRNGSRGLYHDPYTHLYPSFCSTLGRAELMKPAAATTKLGTRRQSEIEFCFEVSDTKLMLQTYCF